VPTTRQSRSKFHTHRISLLRRPVKESGKLRTFRAILGMLHNPVDAFVDVPISATALLAFGAGENTRKRGCEGEEEDGGFHGGLELGNCVSSGVRRGVS
jgi:hypothetical protein